MSPLPGTTGRAATPDKSVLPPVPFPVKSVGFVKNSSAQPINQKQDILGMDGLGFNLRIELTTPRSGWPEDAPDSLSIRLTLREPGHLNTVPVSIFLDVPQVKLAGRSIVYELVSPAENLNVLMAPDLWSEVMTVVRQNGTS